MPLFKKNINKFLFTFFIIIFFISCEDKLEIISISINGHNFEVEVAITVEQRQKGLMYRKSLDKNKGMLFVFESDDRRKFYMKNTYIPLSIAYILSNSKIVQIEDMEPLDLTTIESRISCRYALEVGQGVFRELGIKEGDYVQFPEGFK